jgi:Cu/Zn superoxide dismutase
MNKRLALFIVSLAFLVADAHGQLLFTAALDSTQEVPAPTPPAGGTGTGWFSLNEDRTELTYHITVNGLSGGINAAHFHNAPPGVSGGVVRAISFTGATASGVWKNTDTQALTDSMVRELLRGRVYVNLHTSTNPAGEIRGQLRLAGELGFSATLDTTQEVPAPSGASTARGTGTFTLNATRTELEYHITVTGLTGTINAGHFHNAPAGIAGGVVRALSFTGNSASGVWKDTDAQPLTDSLVTQLLLGRLYVNIHTSANPAGEIRGQVLLTDGIAFRATLDTLQEVPTPTGAFGAGGTGWFSLNSARTELQYHITFHGLTGPATAAHFHRAEPGISGSVVRPITLEGNTASGTWGATDAQPFTSDLFLDLLMGRVYVNVHTSANPAGEIRGQVDLASGIGITAQLDSTQEIPAPTGAGGASGTGAFTLNATRTGLDYRVTVAGLTGPPTAAHFHNAPPGVSGGVVRAISLTGNTGAGTWTDADTQALSDSMVSELLRGRIYVNVHTSTNPPGEIRGQLGIGPQVVTEVEQISAEIPSRFLLEQNYPNPFNPTTTIRFSVPEESRVSLKIFNLLGQEVATLLDGNRPAGSYVVTVDARSLASGLYFYRLMSRDGISLTRKMMLLK